MSSIVGGVATPVASGGNYTPGAGTNRIVFAFAMARAAPAVALTNITYNSITKAPVIHEIDTATGDRDTAAVCGWVESELPGGAAAMTPTWAGTPADSQIVMLTVSDAKQTGSIRTPVSAIGPLNPGGVVHGGLVFSGVPDLVIGLMAQRGGFAGTLENGFSPLYSVGNSEGGRWELAYKVAAAASEELEYTLAGADDFAAIAIAVIDVSAGGGGGANRRNLGNGKMVGGLGPAMTGGM